MAGGLPVAADFAAPPDAATRRRWAEAERSHRPGRVAALRARMAAEGVDAYFGAQPRAHALADGLRARGGRGPRLGAFRPVPRRRRPGHRRDGLAIHDPGPAGDLRGPRRRGRVRPARCLAPAARLGRRAAGRRRGRLHHPRALAAPRGRRAGRGARAGRGLGRGPARREAARRDRADRGRLCRRRPRARHAAARDPGRRHGGRPRAAPRVADPRRRRGGARVRRRLPLGAGGRPPARLAGRSTGAPRCGAAVRLRRPGRGLPQRHDPHAVRRRADRTRPGRLRPGQRGRSRRRSTGSSRRSPRAPCRRAVASRTRSPGP